MYEDTAVRFDEARRDPASASPGATLNLIWIRNQVGLARHAEIVRTHFERWGWRVRDLDPRSRNAYRDRVASLWPPASGDVEIELRADVNLHLEKPFHRWRFTAPINALLPNPEWCPRHLLIGPGRLDVVLCMTEQARQAFSELGCRTERVGFTSLDRRLTEPAIDYDACFHLAGRSLFKGTQALVDVWRRHPEWPTLTIVQARDQASREGASNIELIEDFLPDEALQHLQNRCGIHLYPSTCEAWGHALVEGMSCEAVVVTTNGAPMNELVTSERGVLVEWERTAPHRLSNDYFVDPAALERRIGELLAMPLEKKVALGRSARTWFEANDAAFRERLEAVSRAWHSQRDPASEHEVEASEHPRRGKRG